MTGYNYVLDVVYGSYGKIGELIQEVGTENLAIKYQGDWQKHTKGHGLSPHLSLDGEHSRFAAENFIRNLLPEGNGFSELIDNTGLGKSNTFGLIRAIGAETSGAMSFLGEYHTPTETNFRKVEHSEIEEKLKNRELNQLTVWDGKRRLSVAGVQDKLNLIFRDGKLGLGDGDLCSTHIAKFETDFKNIVVNELFSMKLAERVGLSVAPTEYLRIGEYPTLLVERFDRKLISVDKVGKRHIIDGCQATNLPPSYKYERNLGDNRDVAHIRDGVSFKHLFDIEAKSSDQHKQALCEWIAFNIIIGNYDAHGKNISYYYDKSGITLAPFYDLVCIEAIEAPEGREIESTFAMALGDSFDAEVGAYDIAGFIKNTGQNEGFVSLIFSKIAKKVIEVAETIEGDLISAEYNLSESEKEHITKCVTIAQARAEMLQSSCQVKDLREMAALL
ncbi:TPA: type II toxin-antitoxin system HipA family toxin [Vibrio vulnificus]|uniref:Type II toxin-antitoxin system HipA family toxin n=1 Tax=Vibrio vulnificus TaxID=672 RepID=A0A8H9K5U1_VIBVL|nr:type II toxin-antitoxin system HipA family toxin [Vibrio vulnificus]